MYYRIEEVEKDTETLATYLEHPPAGYRLQGWNFVPDRRPKNDDDPDVHLIWVVWVMGYV